MNRRLFFRALAGVAGALAGVKLMPKAKPLVYSWDIETRPGFQFDVDGRLKTVGDWDNHDLHFALHREFLIANGRKPLELL